MGWTQGGTATSGLGVGAAQIMGICGNYKVTRTREMLETLPRKKSQRTERQKEKCFQVAAERTTDRKRAGSPQHSEMKGDTRQKWT